MSKAEYVFVAFLIGPVVPVCLFLSGWWAAFFAAPEEYVPAVALMGLGAGIAVDIAFLKGWIRAAYSWNEKLLLAVFAFYSVCVLGFFMGVPVFNLVVGWTAGVFWGRRLAHCGVDEGRAAAGALRVARASAVMMGLVSFASAYIVARDVEDTARNLRGMLGLPFTPTDDMVIGLIIAGGTVLVAAQYWVAKKAALWAYRIGRVG